MKLKTKRKTKIEKLEERILKAVRKGNLGEYTELFTKYRCAVVPSAGLTEKTRRERFGLAPKN
jgi:hypothetical protein